MDADASLEDVGRAALTAANASNNPSGSALSSTQGAGALRRIPIAATVATPASAIRTGFTGCCIIGNGHSDNTRSPSAAPNTTARRS